MLVLVLLQATFVSVFASVVFEDCDQVHSNLTSLAARHKRRRIISWNPVDSGSAYDLQDVHIEGCGVRMPCLVTLGEDVPVRLQFRAGFASRKLDQNVVISINHVNLRTNVTPELCDSVVCPISTHGLTSFSSVMTVPVNMALNQRGYLRWRIYNESGMMVLCYSVVVQTQSSLQKLLRTGNSF